MGVRLFVGWWRMVISFGHEPKSTPRVMRISMRSIVGALVVSMILPAVQLIAQTTRGPGTAIRFNGESQYVAIQGSPYLAGNALTLELWVRPSPTRAGGALMWSATTQPDLRLAFCQGSALLCFEVRMSSGYQELVVSTQPINFGDGNWHHVAATCDGNQLSAYVDGVLLGSRNVSGALLVGGPQVINRPDFSGYAGDLDEVRVWSTARSQHDIQQMMNQPLNGNEAGLEGHYQFNEGSGSIAHDSTGHGRDGQLINLCVPPWFECGWITSAIWLGQPLAYTLRPLEMNTNSAMLQSLSNPNGWPTGVWFQWGEVGHPADAQTPAISAGSGTALVQLGFTLTNLLPNHYYAYHCVATNTYGSATGSNYVFLTLGRPAVNTLGPSDYSPTGARLNGVVIPNGFETAAWFEYGLTTNYASRTAATLLGAGTGEVAISNIVSDLVPQATVHCRVVATNAFGINYGPDVAFNTLGPAGMALQFNGLTTSVALPVINLSGANKLTLEAWVVPVAFQRPVLSQWRPGSSPVWTLLFGTSQTVSFGLSTTAGYQRLDAWLSLPGYADGPWHHLAVSYDGSLMKLYHNARLLSSKPMTGLIASGATVAAIGLGPDGPFNGQIDEVRIWSGARTQVEIEQGRFRRLTGTEPGLEGYWRLDEGTGTSVEDASGHSRTGNFSNSPLWVPSGAPLGLPFAQANEATLIGAGVAVLNGLINPDGYTTSGWFEWGMDTNYSNAPQIQHFGDGNVTLSITQSLAGLNPNTTYHFRAVAANTNGTMTSANKTFVLGSNNKALSFGGADDYVHLPPVHLSAGNNLSIEAWIKPEAIDDATTFSIIRQEVAYYTTPYSADWLLALYGNSLSFGLNTGLPYPNHFPILSASAAPGRFDDGRWHHVAATYDGSVKRLYHNGVEIASASQSGNIANGGTAGAIGSMAWGGGEFFRGVIEEVRVWAVVRSQTQIIQAMNQPLAGTEPGLLAYFPFSEGAGDFTADQSGHSYRGQLMGSPIHVVSDALGRAACVTLPVTNLSHITAVLNAAANPAGSEMHVWFEWGNTTNYSHTTIAQFAGAGSSFVVITQALSALVAGTEYHCRAVGSNANEVVLSSDVQFVTRGPQVSTLSASALDATNMTLNGVVNSRESATRYWFEWGTNATYGFATSLQDAYGDARNYSETVTGLIPGQTYHYRVMATNSGGLAVGQDQTFTVGFGIAFTPPDGGLYQGAAAWGDYDRDGDLDLVATGSTGTNGVSGLFRRDDAAFNLVWGTAWFPLVADPSFPRVSSGSATWCDLSNDGTLDLFLTGRNDSWLWPYGPDQHQIARGWLNRNGVFTNLIILTGVTHGAAAIGDYDNDGYNDILLAGKVSQYNDSQVNPTNILYHNNGNGTFTDVQAGLPAVFDSAVAWGDYDNDGQLDILLAGDTGNGLIARIYHNKLGTFTDISAGLMGVASGSVAWGDYDGDGWLDILLAGSTNGTQTGAVCRIYRNNHDGTFVDTGATLPGVYTGNAAWGDYDNDGQLDILLTGTPSARIYRNSQGVFTDIAAGLPSTVFGSGAWGDYDGDGKLDLAINGASHYGWWGSTLNVFRNFLPITNSPPNPPSAPGGLLTSVLNNKVTLRWNAASDAHTPTPGLTYNLRVGTAPGGGQIVPSQSDPITGQRRLPQRGNAEHRLFATLTNLPLGLYYWSVQTVNNSFVGSLWAPEQTLAVTSGPPVVVTRPASNVLCCSALLNGFVTPGVVAPLAWFEWGTSTNFGNSTPPQELEIGLLPKLVQQTIPDLQPRTTYFFRLAATNSAGLVLGTNLSFTTEGPAPLAATLGTSNVAYTSATPFGASPLASPTADYFIEWGRTAAYGQLTPATVRDAALGFDGVDDCVVVGWGKFPDVTNNFTIELWANPAAARALTPESTTGVADFGPQRLAVFPEQGAVYGDGLHAGVGLSVGTNGISVLEHRPIYLPAVLVYSNAVSDWNHIALVYSNHLPMLYLNAVLVRTGLVSTPIVHPSAAFGGTTIDPWVQFWPFAGALEEIRIWDIPLNAPTIQAWMNQSVTANHPAYSHLQGYWPLTEGRGTNVADGSPRNNPGQLLNGTAWTAGPDSSAREFSAILDGLSPGMTYHFRAVAINPGGTAYGADQTFTTLPVPRVLDLTVQTAPATAGSLLRCSGSAGFGYVMETSTNLVDWLALTNLVAESDGLFEFLDTTATNFPTRFYRLRVP
jgi:hypothetical protein